MGNTNETLSGELSEYDAAYNRLLAHGWTIHQRSEYVRQVLGAFQRVCADAKHECHTGPICKRTALEWAEKQLLASLNDGLTLHQHLERKEASLMLQELAELLK